MMAVLDGFLGGYPPSLSRASRLLVCWLDLRVIPMWSSLLLFVPCAMLPNRSTLSGQGVNNAPHTTTTQFL